MAYKIDQIEGIGEVYAEKLIAAGIATTDDLLEKCAAAKGRIAIAEETGISRKLILKWTNHADLMRINGIAGQFSELLEAAGVDRRSSVIAFPPTSSPSSLPSTRRRTSATVFLR